MPEGDTILAVAQRLRPLLVGRTLEAVDCRWPRVVEGLRDAGVRAVETRGKHLLIRLTGGVTLRVHLGLKGSWHHYPTGATWRRSRGDMGLVLATQDDVLVCFFPPTVERIDDRALAAHPVLSALGPDLIEASVDLTAVVARARSRGGPLGEVLLDQQVACGLGNVYRSELCFLARRLPEAPLETVDDEALRAIYAQASTLLRANVDRPRNTTGRRRPLLWVYGRGGRPCLICGARIRSRMTGERPRVAYGCPRCQS